MGIFDIFKKKECDICGGEIGLLGNRKLEDGNMCKGCAKLLSPWFDERRHSTIEQIKSQLAAREANKALVASFNATRTFGTDYILSIDEGARTFMVPKGRKDENPDVIELSQVTGVTLDVDERSREIMREFKDSEGNTKKESYNPRRWEYSYDFDLVIRLNHPYIDDIRFRLNDTSVDIDYTEPQSALFGLITTEDVRPTSHPSYIMYERMAEEATAALLQRNAPPSPASPAAQMSEADATVGAPAPESGPWVCPSCNANNEGGKFCEFCGGARS